MKVSVVQISTLILLVYLGWRLASKIIILQGDDWMWGMEVHFFFIIMVFLIIIGNYVSNVCGKKAVIIVCFVQLIVLLSIWYLKFDLRPLRSLYLFVCGTIVVFIPFVFNRLGCGWIRKDGQR